MKRACKMFYTNTDELKSSSIRPLKNNSVWIKKYLTLIFLTINIVGYSQNDSAYSQANRAYQEQRFNDAIAQYETILDNGYFSSELYYNIANAYYKANRIPDAILNYEKAMLLNPSNEDIDYNLSIARLSLSDKIEELPELFLFRWSKSFMLLLTSNQWAWVAIFSFIISLVFMLGYLFSTKLKLRKLSFFSSVAVFMLFVISFASSVQQYKYITQQKSAIVFTPTVVVKSSPDIQSTDLFVIHEGVKVQLLDKIGEWYEIKIANGNRGWILASDFKKI